MFNIYYLLITVLSPLHILSQLWRKACNTIYYHPLFVFTLRNEGLESLKYLQVICLFNGLLTLMNSALKQSMSTGLCVHDFSFVVVIGSAHSNN